MCVRGFLQLSERVCVRVYYRETVRGCLYRHEGTEGVR